MARDFHCGFKTAVYVRRVGIRRVVEREGVIKCLTVRCCARPLGAVAGRQASTQPLLATSATSNRAAVGSGIGSVRKPRPAWAVCAREAGARAGLASAGRCAEAPACGQAVGSRLARTNLDFGRGSWLRGNAERMNGQAKDLSDRNTCFTFCSDERGLGLAKNLRLMAEKMLRALRSARFFGLASQRFRLYRWGPSDQAVHSRGQPPDGFGEGWLRSRR